MNEIIVHMDYSSIFAQVFYEDWKLIIFSFLLTVLVVFIMKYFLFDKPMEEMLK